MFSAISSVSHYNRNESHQQVCLPERFNIVQNNALSLNTFISNTKIFGKMATGNKLPTKITVLKTVQYQVVQH